MNSIQIIILMVMPLISSLLSLAFRKLISFVISLAISSIALVLNMYMFIKALSGHEFSILTLKADSVGLLLSEIILFICLLSIVYAYSYLNNISEIRFKVFNSLIYAFAAASIGLAFAQSLLGMLLFLEVSTALSAMLILYGERKRKAALATVLYLAFSVVESIFIISGMYFLARSTSLNVVSLEIYRLARMPIPIRDLTIASILILIGFATKSGILPLGILWLPYAHSEAPAPISAILSGVTIEIPFIAALRCLIAFSFSQNVNESIVASTLTIIGLLSIWVGIIGMIFDKDLKRVIAYSSIVSLGSLYMVTASSLFAWQTVSQLIIGLSGMLYYLTIHSISKALLFFASGSYLKKFKERNWHKLSSATRALPITSLSWVIAAISISGLVPYTPAYNAKHFMFHTITGEILDLTEISPTIISTSLYASGLIELIIFIGFTLISARAKSSVTKIPSLMLTPKIILAVICILMTLMIHRLDRIFLLIASKLILIGGG